MDRSGQGARHRLEGLRRRSAALGALVDDLRRAARRADGRRGALGGDVKRFAVAFTVVFVFAYASWFIGSWAYLAAVTPADQAKFGVGWSLRLTNEGGYIVALIAGLIVANFFPRLADWLKEAIRPELYIKIAIVILGAFIAVTAAGKLDARLFAAAARRRGDRRGLSDLLAGGLFHRPQMVRLQPRMGGAAGFRHIDLRRRGRDRHRRRDPRPPAGCGAGLLAGRRLRRRRSADPALSSPRPISPHEPLVAAAWLGLAVKTDGAAVAAGGITRCADPRQERRRGRQISARLDSRRHRDGESVHRHVHRRLGLHPRLYLDEPHQPGRRRPKGAGRRDLGALPEIHPRLRRHLRDRAWRSRLAAPAAKARRARSARPTISA